MNKKDLKKLKIDPSYVISPERFITMFGIESDNIKKLSIHDLHYILGNSLNHAGVSKITSDKVYTGEIILIGNVKYFKAYYRPIIYKVQINNTVKEKIKLEENSIINMSLSELCNLYATAINSEELDKYLDEIYDRSSFNSNDELKSNRVKIYSFANKTRQHWNREKIRCH